MNLNFPKKWAQLIKLIIFSLKKNAQKIKSQM